MKKAIIPILLIVASCTKKDLPCPPDPVKCDNQAAAGKWRFFAYQKASFKLCDSVFLYALDNGFKAIFPGHTRVNGIEVPYESEKICQGPIALKNEQSGVDFSHTFLYENDTLTDYIINVRDTIGIKFYKRF